MFLLHQTHTEPQPKPSPTQPSVGDQTHVTESSSRLENTQHSRKTLEGTGRSEGDQVQLPHDSPLLGGHISDIAKGGLNLKELFVLCTNLSNRVLALETSKDTQATEILKLKTRIMKLEKIAFDNLNDDGMDYMDIEEGVNEGRLCKETKELNVTHD
ncbi:hypothetical protein Tco_0848245, partial [Tanacetum coccineum]